MTERYKERNRDMDRTEAIRDKKQRKRERKIRGRKSRKSQKKERDKKSNRLMLDRNRER